MEQRVEKRFSRGWIILLAVLMLLLCSSVLILAHGESNSPSAESPAHTTIEMLGEPHWPSGVDVESIMSGLEYSQGQD